MDLCRQRPAGMTQNRYAVLMHVNPSSLYYESKGESEENMSVMEAMDRIYTEHPTSGIRTLTSQLRLQGMVVNHKRVSRLMKVMGLEAVTPVKCLSKGGNATKYIAPYLLRNMAIDRPNQVWSTDISYIPMKHGFMYLYAIIDVYSRCILGWTLSNTLAAENCIELLNACVAEYGAPGIINSDQGSQYTGMKWKEAVEAHGIRMSMDGRGRCKDNIWIERFWRSVKQEYVYLNPVDDARELREGIAAYMEYYNKRRPHQGISGNLPCLLYAGAA